MISRLFQNLREPQSGFIKCVTIFKAVSTSCSSFTPPPPPPPPPPPLSLGLSHFTEHVVFIRRVGLEHKGRSAMLAIHTPLLLCLPSIISYEIVFAHSARASSHSALWCQLQIYPQNLNIQTWPEFPLTRNFGGMFKMFLTLKISFFKNCWLKGFFGGNQKWLFYGIAVITILEALF